jgi:maleate cis-trans isomerase
LNEEALAEDKADFDTYFEKVVDARLVFSPTAAEATQIALPRHDSVIDLLRRNCEALNISNIRVIKKIERLVFQVVPHLKSLSAELTQQAVHSLTLFGWSKFQPTLAPPLDFYRVGYVERYFARRANKTEPSPEEKKWSDLLTNYNFMNMDEFDRELMKFVDTGVLDVSSFSTSAAEHNAKIELQKKTGSLEMAFRPFHDSFDANIVEVTRSIVVGLKANIAVASLSNLDAAVTLLKQIGKENEAREVLSFFEEHKSAEFWDASTDPFQRGPLDADVTAALTRQKAAVVNSFDAEAELIRAGQTYDSEAIKRLAEVPIDDFYKMIKSKKGDEMRKVILSALEFRRISNVSPEMREVVQRMEEALRKIGSESPLNAVRVQRYGITVDEK